MKKILRYIYASSFLTVIAIMFISIILWAAIHKKGYENRRGSAVVRCINLVMLVATIVIILYTTILSRNITETEVCIIPLFSFAMAREQPELYRSMLMNVLLFVPLGLTVPYVLKRNYKRKIVATILVAFVISLGIESVQYIFSLGRAEIDDIIFNMLGATIGSVSYRLSNQVEVN